MIRYYRHVPLARVEEFQGKGWVVAHDLQDCHHGFHAVLMIYGGDGEPD